MSEARIGLDARGRAWTVAAVAAIHLAAIGALISAFGVDVVVQSVKSIAAFDVPVPPPPPPPEPSPEPKAEKQSGAKAPPAPRATPSEAAAPKPKVVIQPKPKPSVAAAGNDARAGASTAGTGSGAAGQGSGTGAGGRGSGGGIARRAEKVAGELRTRDFPRSGADQRDGRFIVVRYDVGTDGRVANCRVIQSSGSAEADAITCRLVEKRFRYRPAEDAAGNPLPDQTGWKQWWWRPV